MGNNVSCRVVGIYRYTLEKVKYVPKLNSNIISMGDLDDIGLEGKIGNDILKVTKGSLVSLKVSKGMESMPPRPLLSFLIL